MLPNPEVLQTCLHLLSQNQIIVIPLNGIYYLASLPSSTNEKNLLKITQNATPIEYLFSSFGQLQAKVLSIPVWSNFLVKEVLPNHLTCILPGKTPILNFVNVPKENQKENSKSSLQNSLSSENNPQNSLQDNLENLAKTLEFQKETLDIYCNHTSHPYTQKILENLETPLIIVKAILADQPPAITLAMLRDYFGENVHYFLPPKYMITGVGPTVIDLTNPSKLTIIEPGILEKKDFVEFISYQIPIEESFKIKPTSSIYHTNTPITLEENYTADQSSSVIIGTKEKLREVFGVSNLLDYHNKVHKGQVLLNLGSQTNLENVARHLSQKIHEAGFFGMSKIVFLNQNWGKNKWGKIISFYLEKYTQKPEKPKITIQKLIIPKIQKESFVKKISKSLANLKIPKISKISNLGN